ncbi:MAG: DUF3298 and DUF4163 domain-containing protein [Clostridiales bacterium]|jgi:hypothetical protein|nr:DUF3298 and DUF4163 domain-containing protein [Clostridiales bacterium]
MNYLNLYTELYNHNAAEYYFFDENASYFEKPENENENTTKYSVTYDKNGIFSYYRDNYVYTGGAHGITTRTSRTFDPVRGKVLRLRDFLRSEEEVELAKKDILKQAEERMKENPSIFFNDYKELLKKNFNPENFYVSDKGLIIYYQQYDIAPYSTGIVEFSVPYKAPR